MHPLFTLRNLVFVCTLLVGSRAMAIPLLQLDIGGGVYDTTTETTVATSSSFTLYAYLTPKTGSAQSTGPGPSGRPGTGGFWVGFNVDTSLVQSGYQIHFDLYDEKARAGGDIDVDDFAPFSHDAQSGGIVPVPEPATLALLAAGVA